MKLIEFNNVDDDFEQNVRDINSCLSSKAVVLVWAVWCPHCVSMKDDWQRLKSDLQGKNVHVVEIESSNLEKLKTQDPTTFKKLYPSGDRVYFPMIQTWKDKKPTEYNDERTYDKMKSILQAFNAPAKNEKNAKNAKKGIKAKKAKTGTKKQRGGGNSVRDEFANFEKELAEFITNAKKKYLKM
jgi:thiol-disulfide isomerase/thioredoxin